MYPNPLPLGRRTLMAGTAAATLAAATKARAAVPTLELVATFTSPRQVTGVAVSRTGRIFANFPRREEDVAISVGELMPDGSVAPHPNAAWNACRNADPAAASPADSFVCAQSVTVDAQGRLWVLDAAAPGSAFIVSGGPKLVCIDLSTNTVSDTIHVAPLAALFDASLSAEQVGASVHVLARSFVADGYWLTRELVPLLTSCEDNAVKRINTDGSYSVEVQDDRLLWPDGMAEGPDGAALEHSHLAWSSHRVPAGWCGVRPG